MRVVTSILKTTLIKFKRKSVAKSVDERLRYIKKILVKDTIVLRIRIGKKSK